ncbi:Ribonucleoside-diphosphate reductase [Pandoravirus salinus]|uniref:Ribonucleoside-diphosphate reductase n=1 Tax=Pandoravirus salinus TaxID=1349410 RepID=S4W654_9VIRU|nr:ribonucleotide reductase [Pandoravirus salinus]AGO85895.1 Ribonucleoside-diphosphate reductase [Pandoravirus salinus]
MEPLRQQQQQQREQQTGPCAIDVHDSSDATTRPVDVKRYAGPSDRDSLTAKLAALARLDPPLDSVLDLDVVVRRVVEGSCPGMTPEQGDTLLAETAVALSSTHLDYEKLAVRVAVTALHAATPPRFSDAVALLAANVDHRTDRRVPLVSDEMAAFVAAHKEALDAAIRHERDLAYSYFGLATLRRSYLTKVRDAVVERPQYMIMRVAIGHYGFADVQDALARVLATYEAMSQQSYTAATPTLFNAGTARPQNSSCFLLDMKADSIEGIYETLKKCALISKAAGGIGFAAHKVRASGAYVAGTNGESNGLVPMLRVFNDTARYVDQCFSGDTLVLTAERGPVPIGLLYREAAIDIATGPASDGADHTPETSVVPTTGVSVLSDDGRWCPLRGVVRHAPSAKPTYLIGAGSTFIPHWAMPPVDALRFGHGVRVTAQHQVQVLCDLLDDGRPVVIANDPPTTTANVTRDDDQATHPEGNLTESGATKPIEAATKATEAAIAKMAQCSIGEDGESDDDGDKHDEDGDNVSNDETDADVDHKQTGRQSADALGLRLASLCERIDRGYVVPRMVDADDLVPGAVLCVPIPPEPTESTPSIPTKASDWRMAGILHAAIVHGAVQIGARADTRTATFINTYLAVADPDCASAGRPKNGIYRWRIAHPGFDVARSLAAREILASAPTSAIETFVRGVSEGLDGSGASPFLVDTLRWLSLRLTKRAASFSPNAEAIAAGKAAILSCRTAPSPLSTAPTANGIPRTAVAPWSIVHGDIVHVPIESIDTIIYETDDADNNNDVTRENIVKQVGTSGAEGDDGALYDLEVDDPKHTYSVLGFGACHNGGGKRKGAFACYLEPWHADLVDWLDLKKNHGKEENRARDLFYGLWTCDLFMRRVVTGGDWSLFCPSEAPGLHECHGAAFDALYERYEREGRARTSVPARQIWSAIVTAQIETGAPYMLHKDAVNLTSNQQNLGTTMSANLCTEVVQFSSPTETATCLSGDTLITTDKGLVRLDACDGANVLVPFKTDEDLVDAPRYERACLIDNDIKPVFRIETKNGAPFEATADHKVLIVTGRDYYAKQNKYHWVRVDQLQPGDKIATSMPTVSPQFGIDRSTDDKHKAHLAAGWCLGDGWCLNVGDTSHRVFGVCFGPTEEVAQAVVLDQLATIYNTTKPNPNYPKHHGVPRTHTQPNGVVQWQASRDSFVSMMSDKFGFSAGRGPTKRVGAPILTALAEEQAAFLSGLFCADGTVGLTCRSPYVGLSSASRGLLEDVQLMLRCFGIAGKVNWTTIASRGTQQGSLDIRGKESIRAFHRYIGFRLSPQKQAKLETALGFAYKVSSGNRAYEVVKSITAAGDKHVYDLSVPSGHHFVANGKVVHNCNLSSVALPKFVIRDPRGEDRTAPLDARYDDAGVGLGTVFDHGALHETVQAMVANLNRVIDINHYPVPEARHSNLRHRPMGVGVQGLADAFAMMDLPWESAGARRLNRTIFETIYHAAATASAQLAAKEGPYPSYYEGTYVDGQGNEVRGSPASRGLLHPDLWAAAVNDRRRWAGCDHEEGDPPEKGIPLPAELRRPFDPKTHESGRWDWDALRALVRQYGLRNSLLVALMPTATTSQILGNTEACEVITSNIYTRRVLSGDFTVVNRHLVERMMARGLWTPDFRDRLIAAQGSVQGFDDDEVPPHLKALFKTVWEVSNRVTIDMAADRAPYVDQSQSLNLYCAVPNAESITSMHAYAWRRGLKTGMYYLRTRPAANAIQFTVDQAATAVVAAADATPPVQDAASAAPTPTEIVRETPRSLRRTAAAAAAAATAQTDGDACYAGCESCSG